jgi:hypothetical protein
MAAARARKARARLGGLGGGTAALDQLDDPNTRTAVLNRWNRPSERRPAERVERS